MKKLELTHKDLTPQLQKEPPKKPMWFHFILEDGKFHEAEVVTYQPEKGPLKILKDRYGNADR